MADADEKKNLEAMAANLEQEMETRRKQQEVANEKAEMKEKEIKTQKKEIDMLNEQIKTFKAELARTARDKEMAEDRNQDVLDRSKTAETKAALLEHHVELLNAEIRALRKKATPGDKARDKLLEDKNDSLERVLENRTQDLANTVKSGKVSDDANKTSLNALKIEQDKVAQKEAEMKIQKEKIDDLQKRITLQDSEITAKNVNIKLLTEKFGINRNRVALIQDKLADAKVLVEDKQKEIGSQSDTLKQKEAQLEEEKKKTAEKDDMLKTETTKLEEQRNQYKELKNTLATSDRTITSLEQRLQEAMEAKKKAEAEAIARDERLLSMGDKAQASEDIMEEQKNEIASLKTELESLSLIGEQKDKRVNLFMDQLTMTTKDLNEKNAALVNERQRVRLVEEVEIRRKQYDIDAVSIELQSAKSQLVGQQDRYKKLLGDYDTLKGNMENREREIVELQEELRTRSEETKTKDRAIQEVNDQMLMERGEVKRKTDAYNILEEKFEKVLQDMDTQEELISELREAMKELQDVEIREHLEKISILDRKQELAGKEIEAWVARSDKFSKMVAAEHDKVKHKHQELQKVEQMLKTTEDVTLREKEEEIELLTKQLDDTKVDLTEEKERTSILSEKGKAHREELKMRVEQLRLIYEKLKAAEEELKVKGERLNYLENALRKEQASSEGVYERLLFANQTMGTMKGELKVSKDECMRLNEDLITAQELVKLKDDELHMAKAKMSSGDSAMKGKEARFDILYQRVKAARETKLGYEKQLEDRKTQIESLKQQNNEKDMQCKQLTEQMVSWETDIANYKEQQHEADRTVRALEHELEGKNEELQLWQQRVDNTKLEMQSQMQLVEQKAIRDRDSAIEAFKDDMQKKMLEESGELGIVGPMDTSHLTDKIKSLEEILRGKDDLLELLNKKHTKTVEELITAEKSLAEYHDKYVQLDAAHVELQQELDTATLRAVAASEELNKKSAMMDVNSNKAVEFELHMKDRSVKMAQMEMMMEEIKTDMTEKVGKYEQELTMKEGMMQDHKEHAVKLGLLYFQTCTLLVKMMISQNAGDEGSMSSNVLMQDLYEEVQNNQVPEDEWPTYIFTRCYAFNSSGNFGGLSAA